MSLVGCGGEGPRTLADGGASDRVPIADDVPFTPPPDVVPNTLGQTCATPAPMPDYMKDVGFGAPGEGETQCDGTSAGGLWYRIVVPARAQLDVRADSQNYQFQSVPAPRLWASEGCEATTCLARGTGELTVPRTNAQRVVLVSMSPQSNGFFHIRFGLNVLPAAAECRASDTYRETTTLARQLLTLASERASTCEGESAPAMFYRVLLRPRQRVVATTNTPYVSLRVLTDCSATVCVAREGRDLSRGVAYTNPTDAEQTVLVAASRRERDSAYGPFDLTLTISDAPAAAVCESAPVVAAGATLRADTVDATRLEARCDGTTARTLFYAVDVPAGRRLRVVGAPGTAVSLFEGCAALRCLGARWSLEALSEGGSATWINPGPDTARRVVALSPARDDLTVDALSARVELTTPTPEGQCATAPILAHGAALSGLSTQSSDQSLAGCEGVAGSGSVPALWWRVVVPAGQRAVATVRAGGASSYEHGLAFFDACGATSCLASTAGPTTPDAPPRAVAWTNTSTEARTVYLAAFGPGSALDVSLTLSATASGATCMMASEVTPEHAALGQRFFDAVERAPSCAEGASATLPAMFYRASVPAGQVLDVTVTSMGAGHNTRIFAECASSACLATSASGEGTPARSLTRWTNPGATTQSVVIAVSESAPAGGGDAGTFDLTVSFEGSPANARCAMATPLTAGVAVAGSLADVGDEALGCGVPSAPALFYSITVPVGRRLEVRIVEDPRVLAQVRILPSCGASACLGEFDTYTGSPWWTNTTSAPQAVRIAVSPNGETPTTPFRLVASLVTPAAHGVCAMALAVTAPITLRDQRVVNGLEPSACSRGTNVLFYRVTIPAHRRLVVRLAASLSFGLMLGYSADCASTTCFDVWDGVSDGFRRDNDSAAPVDVLLSAWMPSFRSLASTVDLAFDFEPIP